jgi:hypothetical protein
MTQKERKVYRNMIQGLSHQLIMDAYKAALNVSEQVYRDLLAQMDADINEYLATHKSEDNSPIL